MKIVDLGGIDVGERSGEDVRLFLVVALQTDAVGGPEHRFKEIRQIHDFDRIAMVQPPTADPCKNALGLGYADPTMDLPHFDACYAMTPYSRTLHRGGSGRGKGPHRNGRGT